MPASARSTWRCASGPGSSTSATWARSRPAARGAVAFLQRLLSNDVADPRARRAVLRPVQRQGGVLDVLFTYRLAPDRFLTVTNADNHDSDLAWFERHARDSTSPSSTACATSRCSPSRARRRARSSAARRRRASRGPRHPCTRPVAASRDVPVCGTGYRARPGSSARPPGARPTEWYARRPQRREAHRPRRARHPPPGGLLPPLRQRHGRGPPTRSRPASAGACKEDTEFTGADAGA